MRESVDTKTRILDSAEKLFGLKGFQATSLRDITADADVNLAAVNYHFQSKDCLIDAVIARKVEPINNARLEMLDAAGPDASVEQILTAFLTPVFRTPLETMVPLMGRVMANPDLFADRVYQQHFAKVVRRFVDALQRALPDIPRADLLWRVQFTAGVMTHTLLLGRAMSQITGGVCDVSDPEQVVRRAVQFVAAGFRAPASNGI